MKGVIIFLGVIILFTSFAIAVDDDDLTDYLIVYFPLDDDWVDDVNNITLVPNNSPVFISAKVSNGANFSGGQSQWANISGITLNQARSTEFWFYPRTIGTHDSGVSVYGKTGVDYAAILKYVTANGWFSRAAGGGGDKDLWIGHTLQADTWYHIVDVRGAGGAKVYVNGVLNQSSGDTNTNADPIDYIKLGIAQDSVYLNQIIDEYRIYNKSLNASEVTYLYNNGSGRSFDLITAPLISNINCTSCNIPDGDTTPPYTTSDTTPTFTFDTDVDSYCRIRDEDQNYTAMGSSRNCTSGEGEKEHTCTLTVQDELVSSTDYAYVSCANVNDINKSNTTELLMNITDLDVNTSKAIDEGIESSVISGATTYSDQQVYLRDMSDNQVSATVDRVAIYGNQRWIFNVVIDNQPELGLFNITPAVYVLEMANISLTEIEDQVSIYINSTKS